MAREGSGMVWDGMGWCGMGWCGNIFKYIVIYGAALAWCGKMIGWFDLRRQWEDVGR